ncbi:hypothetical protein Tco_0891542 [Tanacetum coccineum]|uniref:Uncharacterized protein n=1 Tax=Tanacetum coccineum TaxID=301880 RepID=A0ABQ5C3I8_9ASTR
MGARGDDVARLFLGMRNKHFKTDSKSKEEYESYVKMIVESLKEENMYMKFSNNVEAEQRGSYLDVEGIKWMLYRGVERRSVAKNEFEIDVRQSDLADMMLMLVLVNNRWLSMKEEIASCGSKYLAYLEVEVEFKLDAQELTYTVDMFRDTLKLLVETPDNPFITPVTIRTIESFMQTVGYQGVVNKVSAFYTKFLAQPWQTMFKVFNRCLTTRTSGHDQTKINILQLFHVMVNRTNVDYAALLWCDFMNNVFQKKNVIQYPRFIQLIIADLMEKYPSISRRHDEDYHSIKDDTPLGKKRKQRAGETSSLRKPLKVTIKQMKQSTPSIPPLSDDRERDDIGEKIEKMVEGEEDKESYASEFVDSMLNDDIDDFGTRIEPESYKENPKVVADEDVSKKKDDAKDEYEVNDDDVEKNG